MIFASTVSIVSSQTSRISLQNPQPLTNISVVVGRLSSNSLLVRLRAHPAALRLMLLNKNIDSRDHSSCVLTYEEAEQWLRATWRGYVDPAEAMRGAEAYLRHAAHSPSALLLNDNSALRGPWFDSLDWLAEVWVPQAGRLGLRYVAHVLQNDRHSDIIPARLPSTVPFEWQIFQDLNDAEQWLRQCRASQLMPGPTPANG